MGIASAGFYLLFTLISPNLLIALIGALGLLIAVYYGLTGFAAAWFFRKTLTRSARNFFMRGLIPLAGGVTMAHQLFGAGHLGRAQLNAGWRRIRHWLVRKVLRHSHEIGLVQWLK
jgi:hypothetical protein